MHFVLAGPPDSPYEGGAYWGRLVLPPNYPASPPALYFFTPSGRFETGKKICASFTDFHPESWTVAWTLSTLLIAILSFMLEDTTTAGSISTLASTKQELAARSHLFNAKSPLFCQLFSDLVDAKKGRRMLETFRASQRRSRLIWLALAIVV